MRCACESIADFIERLEAEGPANTFRRQLNFARYRRPLGKGDPANETRWEVSVLVTAVVATEEGQYLLEAGEQCGIDYTDASSELTGTKRADELKAEIQQFAAKWGLRVLPGAMQI